MKNIVFMLLSIFALTACQQEEVETQESKSLSRSAYYGLSADWYWLSYDLGGELIDIRYVDGESGSMDAGYTMHSTGTLLMEVTLHNHSYTQNLNAGDFYLTENDGKYPPYRKQVKIYLSNSYMNNPSVNSITLQANESKTVYFYTTELFKNGPDSYSYNTTPPFIITLHYRDGILTSDQIDVKYDTSSYWEKYR